MDRINAVAQAYRDVLGREPDRPGLVAWSNSKLTIDEIYAGLESSPEGQAAKEAKMRNYLMIAGAGAALFFLMRKR